MSSSTASHTRRGRINWVSVEEFNRLAASVGLKVLSSRRIIRLPGLFFLQGFLTVCGRK